MINIQLTLNREINKKSDLFSQYFNMGFLKFFGSILIVAAIASSAYHHLETPEKSIQEFQSNYATLDALAQQYLKYDIPLDQTNWKVAVKIFGVFQLLVVLLIVLGDSLGGVLYVVSVLGEIFFLVWARFVAGNIATWNNTQLEELSRFIAFLGIALVLSCRGCKQSCKQ